MSDNGDKTAGELNKEKLMIVEARIKELEPQKDDPLIRKELSELYEEKTKLTLKHEETPKDFKIAEIWIKEGQLILDASPEFWMDKLRALGVLDLCKDIVKDYGKHKPKVSIVDKLGFKKFVSGIKRRF